MKKYHAPKSTFVTLMGENLLTKSIGVKHDEKINPYVFNWDTNFSHHGPVAPTDTALKGKDFVLLYFSAAWLHPSQKVLPSLKHFYKACNNNPEIGATIEVVFVSSDRDLGEFQENYKNMPWLSLQSQHQKPIVTRKCHVQGIPFLVVLDGDGLFVTDKVLDDVCSIHGDKGKAKALIETWKAIKAVPLEEAKFSHWAPCCTLL